MGNRPEKVVKMTNEDFAKEMNRSIKEMVYDKQIQLFDEGYGRDTNFWQKACWTKAIEDIRTLVKDDPNYPMDSKTLLAIRTKLNIADQNFNVYTVEKEEKEDKSIEKKKRGRPKKMGAIVQDMDTFTAPKKRGRPRKNPLPEPTAIKRPRGRPRKYPLTSLEPSIL